MTGKPLIAILPTLGMGHFIPLVQLANKLASHHHFAVTLILPSIGPPPEAQNKILSSLPEAINIVDLPPVSFHDFPAGVRAETKIYLAVSLSLDSIRRAFQSLVARHRVVAVIVDLFSTDVFDIAREFNVPPYMFFLPGAMTLSFMFHLPKLDRLVPCEYRDMVEPVKLPGLRNPLHGRDFPYPVQNREDDVYKSFLRHAKRFTSAEGILLNSFTALETDCIKALQKKESGYPPVYPIGPVIQSAPKNEAIKGSECLKWLDDQPKGSVLYVSFGSRGSLSYEQFNELAMGLETSRVRFLWVLKSPSGTTSNASYLSASTSEEEDPFTCLPEGFLGRTRDRGLVVPSWAPQVQVLSHGSTGGFLSHCGWNSTLESIVHGVPLIAWPLYAEQKMNSLLLADDLKVAMKPKFHENGVVGREEIAKVVKGLLEEEEGKTIRYRMKRLKEAAAKAASEGGSSTKSFSEVVHLWKNYRGI